MGGDFRKYSRDSSDRELEARFLTSPLVFFERCSPRGGDEAEDSNADLFVLESESDERGDEISLSLPLSLLRWPPIVTQSCDGIAPFNGRPFPTRGTVRGIFVGKRAIRLMKFSR